MKRQIAIALQITVLYGGQAVCGWSQVPVPVTEPLVRVVTAPAGTAVQGSGNGVGFMDIGHVSWASRNPGFGLRHTTDKLSFTVTTEVNLLLECPAADSGRRALIAAFLQEFSPHSMVSFDGMTLSSVPVVISPLAYCGSTTQHSFQLKVPTSASAGQMNVNVSFQVTLK